MLHSLLESVNSSTHVALGKEKSVWLVVEVGERRVTGEEVSKKSRSREVRQHVGLKSPNLS